LLLGVLPKSGAHGERANPRHRQGERQTAGISQAQGERVEVASIAGCLRWRSAAALHLITRPTSLTLLA